ncbi:hypothetical protein AX17_004538 [Amanita inopinata Kibby_2008]|nr:hypothetical protein AX17_004538 [Amanita inopinata Kibby_2008]
MDNNDRRDRNVDYPRITFHASGRTFDRLFKGIVLPFRQHAVVTSSFTIENTLNDLKQTVKRKLGLPLDSVVNLAQLREGRVIDLEDEDDFDAFYTVAHSQRQVDVQINTTQVDAVASSKPPSADREKRRKHKRDTQNMVTETEMAEPAESSTTQLKKRKVSFVDSSDQGIKASVVSEEPQKKKRKEDDDVTAVVINIPASSHDTIEMSRKKKKHETATTTSSQDVPDATSLHVGSTGSRMAQHQSDQPKHDSFPQRKKSKSIKQPGNSAESVKPDTGGHHPEPSTQTSGTATTVVPSKAMKPTATQQPPLNQNVPLSDPASISNVSDVPIQNNDTSSRGVKKRRLSLSANRVSNTTGRSAGKQTEFAKQLAGAISDMSAANHKTLEIMPHGDKMTKGENDNRERHDVDNKGVKGTASDAKAQVGGTGKRTKKISVVKHETENPKDNEMKASHDIAPPTISSAKVKDMKRKSSASDIQAASANIKDIASKLLAARRKSLISVPHLPSQVDELETVESGESHESNELDTTTDKPLISTEQSGSGSKTDKSTTLTGMSDNLSFSLCAVCSRPPKHDLMDCPAIKAGSKSIQSHIDELRRFKRIPRDERTEMIARLQEIGQNLEGKKRRGRKAKVDEQFLLQPSLSPSQTGSSNGLQNVAGASIQSGPLGKIKRNNRKSSSASSLDRANNTSLVGRDQTNGIDSLSLPEIGDVSAITEFDLDALVRGPQNISLSLDDLPSSDEVNNDSAHTEELSPDLDVDEVETSRRPKRRHDGTSEEDEDNDSDDSDDNEGSIKQDLINHEKTSTIIIEPVSRHKVQSSKVPSVAAEQASAQSPKRDAINGAGAVSSPGTDVPKVVPTMDIPDTTRQQKNEPTMKSSSVKGTDDTAVVQNKNEATEKQAVVVSNNPETVAVSAHRGTVEERTEEQNGSIQSRQGTPSSVDVQIGEKAESVAYRTRSRYKPSTVKTPKKSKVMSLSQVSDDIQRSFSRSISSAVGTVSSPQETPSAEHQVNTAARVSGARRSTRIAAVANERKETGPHRKHTKATSKGDKTANAISSADPTVESLCQETSPAPTPMSLDTWTVLKESSPPVDDEGNLPVDELQASSPAVRRLGTSKSLARSNIVEAFSASSKNPPPTSSGPEMSFPDSQDLPFQKDQGDSASPSDSEEEAEVDSSLNPQTGTLRKFRRLSEIIRSPIFSKRPTLQPAQFAAAAAINKVSDWYGKKGRGGDDTDDESDADSDSDSEVQKPSHIPRSRRAGA